jgi:hypothetical protein
MPSASWERAPLTLTVAIRSACTASIEVTRLTPGFFWLLERLRRESKRDDAVGVVIIALLQLLAVLLFPCGAVTAFLVLLKPRPRVDCRKLRFREVLPNLEPICPNVSTLTQGRCRATNVPCSDSEELSKSSWLAAEPESDLLTPILRPFLQYERQCATSCPPLAFSSV